MSENLPTTLAQRLTARFGADVVAVTEWRGETTLEVLPQHWLSVIQALRDEAEFRFEQAVDVCGLDYLSYGQTEWDTTDVSNQGFSRGVEGQGPGRFRWSERPRVAPHAKRFAVAVQLLSITHNARLRVKGYCADDALPIMPSLTGLHPGVNWFEREAFDLYGIVFEGHPDLRRILTDYGFVGHPFRKDFPLIGNVEVRYDSEKQRVIYEPVSIDPRVLVPRVIRDDSRYDQAQAEAAAGAAAGK
ncbi:MAG TPA: NADH-quinone oxidoreductase subunit C [Tahibacter sp.]|uniref:NADH-quinone oxidoreductase subunit C n=1 Tax=Tahibacter sp. TaxID=2056211 RepID=UPI002CA4159B|nr:NADH-quinone oxidoreductase subunit C [Tahibacter sp.]HSX58962.1 NADH-quinone oxidoreductase subunit C [Tahibacter sp.]